MTKLKVGSKVQWKWLGGTIDGTVEQVFLKPVSRVIKGKKITRNGSKERPAYLVKSEAGNLALKLATELSPSVGKKKVLEKRLKALEQDLCGREFTEADVLSDVDEDFREAFTKLRDFATSLGEQRVYASARAIMFSRRVCYLFVRPQKKYLEMVFFLSRDLEDALIHKTEERSATKFAHTVRLLHADQIEEPLTDWVREAYEAGN